MAGNAETFLIPHAHLGTHILRARERGIWKLLQDFTCKMQKKGGIYLKSMEIQKHLKIYM